MAVAGRRRTQLLSRSDSTLRGHVMAVAQALRRPDVLLRTSRALIRGATGSLAITRTVCAALSRATPAGAD